MAVTLVRFVFEMSTLGKVKLLMDTDARIQIIRW